MDIAVLVGADSGLGPRLPEDDRSPENFTVAFNGPSGHAIEIEAGSLGTWMFIYTAGDVSVPTGGSVSFWNDQTNLPCAYMSQTDDPTGWDYVTVESDADVELVITHLPSGRDGGLSGGYKDNRFCEVRVTRGELVRGDSVVLRVGDTRSDGQATPAAPYTVERINFYVGVDHKGDGSWAYLPYVVTAAILPGPPAKLAVTAPSVAATGEIFALHVRVEDVNSNPRAAFVGDLSVVLDGVECTRVSMSPDDRGIIEVAGLSLSEPGIFRFSVSTVDGLMSAISNPIRCADAPASRVYWGDMHCHADYADAVGSVEWNHDFARNSARLDFFSQTDHIYSTPGWATGAFNRPLVLDVRTMWAECQRQARKWYEPGRFVTFLGYERTPWERRQRAGDLTVWFMDDDSDLVIEDTIAATIESVKQAEGRIFVGTHAAQKPDWEHYPEDVETVMPTLEISAMHQHAEWYLFEALQRGYKFATVGMADEHAGHPGYDVWARFGQAGTPRRPFSVRSALTAVFSHELTRMSVRDAFFARRTYATSGDRILLDVSVNGRPAGAELIGEDAVVVDVEVHGTANVERVDIIRGDRLVHSHLPNELDVEVKWVDPSPLAGEHWYYVRVVQANGGFAWSSPTWVTMEAGAIGVDDLPFWCDVIWPPAPVDRGADARKELAFAARVFGEDPVRFAGCVQIGRFTDYRGAYTLFRGRDGRDGVPIHIHLYDEFPSPRLYIARGWADFGWVRNGGPADELPWPEPTGDWR